MWEEDSPVENLVMGWSSREKVESMWWVSERSAEMVVGERVLGMMR